MLHPLGTLFRAVITCTEIGTCSMILNVYEVIGGAARRTQVNNEHSIPTSNEAADGVDWSLPHCFPPSVTSTVSNCAQVVVIPVKQCISAMFTEPLLPTGTITLHACLDRSQHVPGVSPLQIPGPGTPPASSHAPNPCVVQPH